jgi:hypothetical protein
VAFRGRSIPMLARCGLAALSLVCAATRAQTPEARDPVEFPTRADAVVTVRDAARHRVTPAGRGLLAALDDSGSFAQTRRAWGVLATRLGWSDEQAFDEILGRRVMVVLRTSASGEREWALLTQVSAPTERRLRQRLLAVPRGSVAGLTVLGVEDWGVRTGGAPRAPSWRRR